MQHAQLEAGIDALYPPHPAIGSIIDPGAAKGFHHSLAEAVVDACHSKIGLRRFDLPIDLSAGGGIEIEYHRLQTRLGQARGGSEA